MNGVNMLKKITDMAEKAELKILRKNVEMQKSHIKNQQKRIKNLESMVSKLMKQQGRKRTEIFAAIHSGELLDNDIQTNKE